MNPRRLRVVLPIAALAALFAGVAFATAFSRYALVEALAIVGLYALLAAALHFGALFLTRLAAPLGLLGSSAVGVVVLWHVREQLVLDALRPVAFAGAALLVGLLYWPVLLRGRNDATAGRWLGQALACGAVLLVALAATWSASNALRWHLLRQNRLFGTPAYYALSPSIDEVRSALWDARTGEPALPAPAADVAAGSDLVLIVVDTLRADALAAYGGSGEFMPRLDRYAAASWVFDDILANATWTRPSIASIFTGLVQEEHGAVDRADRLPDARETLAEVLRGAGYETAAFVTNFGAVGRDAGFDQGFDLFEELHPKDDPYARAEEVNARVNEWLARRRHDTQRPLFLYVHYLDPHTPYLAGGASGDPRGAYDRELRYLDDALMDFIDGLPARLGRAPVVLLTSDHGEEFGEHGDGGHGHSLYPEVAHLPGVLRVPGGGSGRIASRLEARDLFGLVTGPLARAADVEAWARARDRTRRYASIFSTTHSGLHRPYKSRVGMRGVELDGWFLIWSAYGSTEELYDRDRDPLLTRNLAGRHPERLASLRDAMESQHPVWSERFPVEHTEDTEAMLRALGYLADDESGE